MATTASKSFDLSDLAAGEEVWLLDTDGRTWKLRRDTLYEPSGDRIQGFLIKSDHPAWRAQRGNDHEPVYSLPLRFTEGKETYIATIKLTVAEITPFRAT